MDSAKTYLSDTDFTLLHGDALDALQQLPSESVHMVCTSPPYWQLRDYGDPGQLGLEKTPEEYVERLVEIFREVKRVLRKDGVVWLNLGSTYAGNRSYQVSDSKHPAHDFGEASATSVPAGYKQKDLVPIPWLVGIALQRDGWWLRSDCIWEKPNVLPSSVTDRPTTSHEYLLLLSKRAHYFYDHVAIRESAEWARWGDQTVPKYEGTNTATGWMQPRSKADLQRKRSGNLERKPPSERDADLGRGALAGSVPWENNGGGRNARSVWTIPTQAFPGAHFAVFAEELVRRCILAGTSERGCCPECGAPWERDTETSRTFESGSGRSGRDPTGKNGPGLQGGGETRDVRRGPVTYVETTGWQPTCKCAAVDAAPSGAYPAQPFAPVPCVVLDPFAGAGTVALVARKLGRHSIAIELSERYCGIIAERTQQLSLLADEPV